MNELNHLKKIDRSPQCVKTLKKLNDQKIINGVLLNYDKPIEAMFYTNLIAYPYIPERDVIKKFISNGYTIIINDDGKISNDIRTIESVKIEYLTTINDVFSF